MTIKYKRNSILLNFILIFTLISSVTFLVFAVFEYNIRKAEFAAIKNDELILIDTEADYLLRELNSIIADINFIRDDFLNYHHEEYDTKKEQWSIFTTQKVKYDQLRYIDENGMEVIRINFDVPNSYIVEDEMLQDKSNRYYFTDSVNLASNQIYVSPLDLNVEKGEVETPYVPMVRFATAIKDENGNNDGIIIVNFKAKGLLDDFRENADKYLGTIYLVNQDGYFLSSENNRDEWGFMLNIDYTFASDYQEEWDQIESGSRQFLTENGLFSSHKIVLSDELSAYYKAGVSSPEEWYIVSVLEHSGENAQYFYDHLDHIIKGVFSNSGLIGLLIIIVSYVIAILLKENSEALMQVKYNASYDADTGALNRRAGLVSAERLVNDANNSDRNVTLCYIDIDGLKTVNDTYGHESGDILIKLVAEAITKEIRHNDIFIRIGGDEFIVMFNEVDLRLSELIWQRIETNLAEINLKEEHPFTLSVSKGMVESSGKNLEEMMRIADEEMYVRKNSKK